MEKVNINTEGQSKRTKWKHGLVDFSNVTKSFIGSNFFSFPFAFASAGYALSLVLLAFVATITYHCCVLLLEIKHELSPTTLDSSSSSDNGGGEDNISIDSESSSSGLDDEEEQQLIEYHNRKPLLTYADVSKRVFGKVGLYITNGCLLLTQVGFCIGYLIFTSETVDGLFANPLEEENDALYTWRRFLIVAFFTLVCFVLTLIKDIRQLGWFSIVADIFLLISIAMLMSFFNLRQKDDAKIADFSGVAGYLGIVIAGFEGIGLVIPVEISMRGSAKKYPIYLAVALALTTSILGTVGVLGYLTYGTSTQSVISLNLPQGEPLGIALSVIITIAVIFTFPLMLVPAIEIIEHSIWKSSRHRQLLIKHKAIFNFRKLTLQRNTVRLALCIFVGVVAFALPFFGPMLTLIGALGSSTLAYSLPVLFDLRLHYLHLSWIKVIKNGFILFFAGLAMVIGVYDAIEQIAEAFHN